MHTRGRADALRSSLVLFAALAAALASGCGKVEVTPDGGGDIDGPAGDDASIDTPATTMFTLTVTGNGNGTGTVTSTPAGINCGVDCTEDYASGTQVTLTASPNSGTTFLGWSGGGCTGTGTCTLTLTDDTTVTASFALNNALVVALAGNGRGTVTSSPAGIDCGADCSETYAPNTTVILSAAPDTGSTFAGWSGGGCSGTGGCSVTITQATMVTATFTLSRHTLMLQRAGNGAGSVTSSPAGISCPTDCTEDYDYGQQVTLTASPSAGSTFTGWSGGGCSGTGACTTTITTATTVAATFTLNRYTLTVMPVGTGAGTVTSNPAGISCGLDCSDPYDHGTAVTLTASASSGSMFAGWSGGGCTGTGVCTTTVTAAVTIMARFDPVAFPDSITRYCTDGQSSVACPGGLAGQDGNYTINVPTYTVAANTVVDSVSGLMWERNPGYTYASWAASNTRCDNLVLDGFSDWRLPTIVELMSLTDAGRVGPPWPTAAFPGIPGNSFFQSSTAYAGGSAQHFGINTNYPVVYIRADTSTNDFSRCVRGTAFTGTLSASGASVIDNRTGLRWQSGIGPAGTWQSALSYCEALVLDGFTDWRLPNTKELVSIVDHTRTAPAISTLFASRPATVFWSSTALPNFPTSSYAIDFNSGATSGIDTPHANTRDVRCVR